VHEILDFALGDLAESGVFGQSLERRNPLDVEVILPREEAARGGILPLSCPAFVHVRFAPERGIRGF
jgi:hypothetical protein